MAARKSNVSTSRSYVSAVRAEGAQETRRRLLDAARSLFVERGYRRTTVADIAAAAGTAVDTVYTAGGRKPDLVRLLLETAISGADAPVPAEERDYVAAIRAEPDAEAKLRLYATAIARIMPRLAPIVQVCVQAGEPVLTELWREIAERRAANMRLLAGELLETGRVRPGLTVAAVADRIWVMNSPEVYLLVTQRGWSNRAYESWLGDLWVRELLESGDIP